jgi:predicted GNAT superfamily acetyltransferase
LFTLAGMSEAWDLARAAARGAGVELRPLTTVEDADRINDVIQATWGGQRLDREVIRALAASGNVPWGGADRDRLVGFVLGWAGVDAEGLHVHSHMLAAVPDRRHRGIGYALKLAQRAQALDQGISVMRWTFDPLVARNAWLNVGKLGALVDRFERDYYGEMTDELNAGERSDRFMVRWELGRPPGPRQVPSAATEIAIPSDLYELREGDPGRASRWRDEVAVAAEEALARGEVGAAFDRDRAVYLFAPREGVS